MIIFIQLYLEWTNEWTIIYLEIAIQYNIMYMFIVIQLYMIVFHVSL